MCLFVWEVCEVPEKAIFTLMSFVKDTLFDRLILTKEKFDRKMKSIHHGHVKHQNEQRPQ